jgi:hypothetical protein
MRPRKFVRSTALVLVLTAALTVTAFAADPTQRPANETDNKSSYYPTSVEMTEDDAGNPMIRKTYQLSVSDDPQKLPVADFERDGRRYYLLDMTKEDIRRLTRLRIIGLAHPLRRSRQTSITMTIILEL